MKKVLRVVLYLVILVMAVYAVSDLFITKRVDLPYNDTTKIRGFFAEPRDTIDVVFVGASTSFMGINPSLLWREYGITSYDFCSAAQRVQLSQMYVREAIERQHPDVICVDIGGMRHSEAYAPAARNYISLNLFPFSMNKLNTIFNYTPKKEWLTHFLPLIKFHSTGEVNFDNWGADQPDPYLGYSPYFKNFNKEVDLLATTSITKTKKLSKNSEKALREIIQVCNENDVQLILYSIPMALTETERQRFNEVKRIAEEEGIPVLDLNDKEWLTANEYDTRYDNGNADKHANWRGAAKITRTFGDYLTSNALVTDRRNDPAYASWDEKTEPYYRAETLYISQEALKAPTELSAYLQALSEIPQEGVITIIAAYDDASRKMTDEADTQLAQLGGTAALSELFRNSYLLVNIDGETVYFEVDEQNPLFYEINLDGVPIKASSAGFNVIQRKATDYPDTDLNKTIINGKSYTSQRGLNIYVYNYIDQELISQASFDTYTTTNRR